MAKTRMKQKQSECSGVSSKERNKVVQVRGKSKIEMNYIQ